MSDKDKDKLEETNNSRINFLKNSGLTVGGLVVGGALGGLLVGNNEPETEVKTDQTQATNPNVGIILPFMTKILFLAQIKHINQFL
ncbi:hypothetical protein NSA56_05085 [Oceanobacillus caeni]|uniref:Uncharacterized protein n=1 Tax=Oceanobacillus caeni TaxID=405946 RepID=A0ABR5MIE6_9BACI|nr:hypothetical protein [Oceanobacillus caeni]KKE77624.1 hypothetical protein WH51_16865 [Bacilli bacterium VT-13-104]PZD83893.1 hypothetical protein DEJ64_13620 [Bacilli bacterium]KPH74304.1 hypothetical protein AFL42_10435 [Oceanobacillus caeni]MBU8791406.1 hypothetical protein [Oceanobacillus caeni]MCR1833768.1 hypothetical protein [Oceanobacillus caeni]